MYSRPQSRLSRTTPTCGRHPGRIPWLIILAAALLSCFLWLISRANLLLGAIIFIAGYALLALSLLAKDRIWLPVFLPLALLGFLLIVRLVVSRPGQRSAADAD